jgi:azurin
MATTLLTFLTVTALFGTATAQELRAVAIELKPHSTVPLAYDKTELTAKAGTVVSLTLNNTDASTQQPHNFVLIKPGKIDAVGSLATAMITDPKAMEKNYIPENTNDILVHTPLAHPGESVTIQFTLPSEPGDYPFICTFPGHWLQMRGTFHVTP